MVINLNDTPGDNEHSRERVPCGHVCPELIIASSTYGDDNHLLSKCKRDKMSRNSCLQYYTADWLSWERLLWSCCWTYGKANDFLQNSRLCSRAWTFCVRHFCFLNKSLQHHRFGLLEESDEHRVHWKHRTLPGSCNQFVFIVVSVDFKHCASYDFSSSIS